MRSLEMTVNEWLKELECWLECRKLYCYQKFSEVLSWRPIKFKRVSVLTRNCFIKSHTLPRQTSGRWMRNWNIWHSFAWRNIRPPTDRSRWMRMRFIGNRISHTVASRACCIWMQCALSNSSDFLSLQGQKYLLLRFWSAVESGK